MPVIVNGSTGITTGTDTVTTITSPTATALTIQSGGTTAMTIDTSQNVGIATASPSFKLDVVGTGRFTGLTQFDNAITLNTATLNYLYYTSAISFSQNGTGERMRIDANGNVGIGTTPSAWASSRRALQVGGSSTVATLGLSSGVGEVLYNTYYDGTNFKYINTNYAASFDYNNAASGGFAWRIAASGTAGNNVTLTQAMTLDSSGNFSFNSGYGSAAVAYGCRVWVNLNGAGGAAAIRGSGGVSSVAYISTGRYTINFTNTMPDTNYAVVFGGFNTVNNDGGWNAVNATSGAYPTGQNTTSVNIGTYTSAGGFADQSAVYVAIFR